MKKLHSFAFYALITPIFALGGSSLLAQNPAGALGQAKQSASSSQEHARMSHKGFIRAVPASGMHSNQLIGAEVKNAANEKLGSVREIVIDEHGQIVALVVGVGGFLGMGEKDVAFGWDDVTKLPSATGKHELKVDLTKENLQAAPEFKEAK